MNNLLSVSSPSGKAGFYRLLTGGLLFFLLFGLFAWQTNISYAHAILKNANPLPTARVLSMPETLTLTFLEPPLQSLLYIEVKKENGEQADKGDFLVNGLRATLSLINKGEGKYIVKYHTVTKEGGVADGIFNFTVKFDGPYYPGNISELIETVSQIPPPKITPPPPPPPPDAGVPQNWLDTGLALGSGETFVCFDPTQLGVFVTSAPDGTYSFNWVKGERKKLNNAKLQLCNRFSGYLYGDNNGQSVRFTVAKPEPQAIEHLPTQLAQDNTLLAYSLDKDGKLWVSSDAGGSWQDRSGPLSGRIKSISLAQADARVVYAIVDEQATTPKTFSYSIYHSSNAAQTWDKRSSDQKTGPETAPSVTLEAVAGRSAPVNLLTALIGGSVAGQSSVQLSSDGGATFREIAVNDTNNNLASFFFSADGLVRKYGDNLELSKDNGQSFQPLTRPYNSDPQARQATIQFAEAAPANFFTVVNGPGSNDHKLNYSPDNGRSWQPLADAVEAYYITPYAPVAVIGLSKSKVYLKEMPNAEKSTTRTALPTAAPDSTFFSLTNHNLRGIFKDYWNKYGGLAQFGYPQTEEFREYNPADGKVYMVQYFERNRFEYHPELAGTQYEVLLGLLGNQLTLERRNAGDDPFNQAPQKAGSGQLYFSETGHNLSGIFRAYWEKNGGLSLYGYPISEEFFEVNPDDGKIYTVQYFERNRFEYHPDQKGTPYEVLLGLLGNTLLKQKGWL